MNSDELVATIREDLRLALEWPDDYHDSDKLLDCVDRLIALARDGLLLQRLRRELGESVSIADMKRSNLNYLVVDAYRALIVAIDRERRDAADASGDGPDSEVRRGE